MITEIKIENFKSVQDLTLQLGRFNVLIGANGSGKSNILEAIAFGGAASADKLDNEFLGARGIRTSSAQLMKSAFTEASTVLPIKLNFNVSDQKIPLSIYEIDKPILKWVISEKETISKDVRVFFQTIFNPEASGALLSTLEEKQNAKATNFISLLQNLTSEDEKEPIIEKLNSIVGNQMIEEIYRESNYDEILANFIIYSPEISSLRKFEEESQIKPLGIKGEGLFNILQLFYENENYGEETINELRKYLHIIEWFDDFEAVFDKVSGRSSLVVRDRNLPNVTLNQHNVNEGFLFLLFYISLIISKETPAFFAIDNIEASFHPKLCEELIKNMVELAKKHNKQIILTTHNPFVLDGLDLNDPEQKLFVVRRNADGETIADNIDKAPKKIKLSEAWMRGYIGGQPETIE